MENEIEKAQKLAYESSPSKNKVLETSRENESLEDYMEKINEAEEKVDSLKTEISKIMNDCTDSLEEM